MFLHMSRDAGALRARSGSRGKKGSLLIVQSRDGREEEGDEIGM